MNQLSEEVSQKLELIRNALTEAEAQGLRLRGTDWFAWATAGGSSTVLLTAETGIAEVLVTAEDAWILTDEIEAQRLKDEEIPENFQHYANPWADAAARESFVQQATNGGKILSDRPIPHAEKRLPASLQQHKRTLMPSELERYRQLGRQASEAMTEVLKAAKPDWTEYQLAGAGAEALWARGIHPALTLVAGERRLPLYRHATATGEEIGRQAMLVFCARRHGLYANLTRFVSFGSSDESAKLHGDVRQIEAEALNFLKPGIALNAVYDTLADVYQKHGYSNAIREHHQGGTTGYLAREVVANPTTNDTLEENMAVAWNPSVRGAKIEDTFVLLKDRLENLTFDPNFPSVEVAGRLRPVPLEVG
ncbi:M24 family metallopeptidase [Coleofasciculus sp. FACHB-1120]|uniref:M24 family metallopeptidase n=1 Tax=Coleofasciculus sp. FACHB-1120 TaxID=2692783 RepID=UPI001686BFB8|nr:M24 family metallopeptidase [Coleofasciculus sp. FACHB-1120]MBD2744499.1 M24 family metallopeptidase [Coleofasciculus sp. FACHB-1120]